MIDTQTHKAMTHTERIIKYYDQQISNLLDQNAELLEALKEVVNLIDSGELVRDTSKDANPDYHNRMVHFTMKLSKAVQAIKKAEG